MKNQIHFSPIDSHYFHIGSHYFHQTDFPKRYYHLINDNVKNGSILLYCYLCPKYPYAPWCWNIYLHLPQKSPSHVGKYSSTMGCIWDMVILWFHKMDVACRFSCRRLQDRQGHGGRTSQFRGLVYGADGFGRPAVILGMINVWSLRIPGNLGIINDQ